MFVEIEEAQNWYAVALDGLRHLQTALHSNKKTQISVATLDQIHGMSIEEWKAFLDERESEHEMFASLAVLASCEGNIRRDASWRGRADNGQAYFQSFRAIAQEQHVPISKIFDVWESVFTQGHPLRRQFAGLRRLYSDRNVIAHGRARRGQFAFELIFTKLQDSLRKWREFVPDFGRVS